ncbi:MAG: hypothetical protein ABR529_13725 [Actinomycetota bacterium]
MAALAYVLPPLSGLIAYFAGATPRMRLHGLQSVLFGVALPPALSAAAAWTPGATQAVAVLGALAWLAFLGGSAAGKDPGVPVLARRLAALAASPPR